MGVRRLSLEVALVAHMTPGVHVCYPDQIGAALIVGAWVVDTNKIVSRKVMTVMLMSILDKDACVRTGSVDAVSGGVERAVYSGAEELNGQRCPGNHADPSWDRVQSPLFSAWEEGGAEAQVA